MAEAFQTVARTQPGHIGRPPPLPRSSVWCAGLQPSGELNVRIRFLLSVSAAVLAGAVGLAPAAFAADADPGHLIALTAHDPTLNGTSYPVRPGETVAVEAGAANLGDKPVHGLVLHLWFIGSEQRLTDNFSNCLYYLDGTTQGA